MSDRRPILFATDGSPSAENAQKMAFELAERFGAPLVVVSVAHAPSPAGGYAGYGYADIVVEFGEQEHKRVAELLAAVAEAAALEGVSCSTVAADGFVVEEICRTAAEYNAQLVVAGSHGWGATRRLFSGSVSTGLVHAAPCAVLVVPSTEHAHQRVAAA